MPEKRQCAGIVTQAKSPRFGRQCRLYAKRGSDYCNLHGGNAVSGPGHPETLERRCIARPKGRQCKKAAIDGGVVCATHGGAAKFVRLKAQQRLVAGVEPAIAVLMDMLMKPSTSDSDRTRIALALLDRTGFGPGSNVEVGITLRPFEQVMKNIMRELPEGYSSEVPARPWMSTDGEDVEDAELVEDTIEARYRARDYLTQIVPPDSSRERATIRRPDVIGTAPGDRERNRDARRTQDE